MTNKYTDLLKDNSSSENTVSNQVKTTDVNILLNRVRLDKKKIIKKNILISLLFVGLISSITIFFNI